MKLKAKQKLHQQTPAELAKQLAQAQKDLVDGLISEVTLN